MTVIDRTTWLTEMGLPGPFRLTVIMPGRHEAIEGWYATLEEAIAAAQPYLDDEAETEASMGNQAAYVYDMRRKFPRTRVWAGYPERRWRYDARLLLQMAERGHYKTNAPGWYI